MVMSMAEDSLSGRKSPNHMQDLTSSLKQSRSSLIYIFSVALSGPTFLRLRLDNDPRLSVAMVK